MIFPHKNPAKKEKYDQFIQFAMRPGVNNPQSSASKSISSTMATLDIRNRLS